MGRARNVVAWLAVGLVLTPSAHAGGWRWPVDGPVATGFRNAGGPYATDQHRGIDLTAPIGASVVAATAGVVRFAGTAGSSGLTVSLRTADGRFDTSYLHLSAVAVRAGETVVAGRPIGAVGATGRGSIATAHLHFGVRDAGSRHGYRDPLTLLARRGRSPDLPRVGPLPPSAPVVAPPRFARVAARPEPRPSLLGWAVACLALVAAAVLLGPRSSIDLRAVLRHHADLLRQR